MALHPTTLDQLISWMSNPAFDQVEVLKVDGCGLDGFQFSRILAAASHSQNPKLEISAGRNLLSDGGDLHDELVNEVHQSINPYYFFKAWREEFQLVIDGFCQLFAGAGVGMSWYEAKKQDLPPQYIDELINQYSEDMVWDEDIDKFLKVVSDGYEEYKIRRVKEYIVDPINTGEIIKPIIYALMVEVVNNIIDGIKTDQSLLKTYNSMFDKELIFAKDRHKIKTLREYLSVFCRYYNLDVDSINIKSPDELSVPTSGGLDDAPEEELTFNDDQYSIEDLIALRGYYRDDYKNIVYFTDKPMMYSGVNTTIQQYLSSKGVFKTEGLFQIGLHNLETRDTVLYNAYIGEKDYQLMVATYNSLNATSMNFAPMAW
jgi:hypothetical protein